MIKIKQKLWFCERKINLPGLVLLVLAVLVFNMISVSSYAANSFELEEMEAFFDGVLNSQLNEHNIPGASLSVVRDGEVLLAKGYGYADLAENKPVDAGQTLFRPGSVSKLITWTAVMQLVEKGELDLDDDVNNYLDFEIPDYLQGEGRAEVEPVTMRHLITHTPGFEDVGEGLFVLSTEEMLSLEDYLKKYLPNRVFPPGELMAYSNYGTALAGYIVQQVTGQPFAEYLEDHIFVPLGMSSSTFRQPLPAELADDMARAYKFSGGQFHEGGFEYISASPAGSMTTTALDMAGFMLAHLQNGYFNGERILQEETVKKMHSQQFTHHARQGGMTLGFIEDEINGERIIAHGGATFLYYSGLFILPEHNLGLFVTYSGGTGMEQLKLINLFMDRYFSENNYTHPEPSAEARERALALRGDYQPNRSNFTTIEKLLGVFQRLQIDVNQEGYLVANIFGEKHQYVEIEPGFYQSRYSQGNQIFNRVAFISEPEEPVLLALNGPTTFNRVPWYGSNSILSLLIILPVLLLIATLIWWGISFLISWRGNRQREDKGNRFFARLTVVGFTFLIFIFLIGLITIVTDIDPAYGVPDLMFSQASSFMNFVLSLPYFMAVLIVAMVIFTVVAWWKKRWTLLCRLHYSFLTVMAIAFLWVLFYVNLL